MLTEINRRIEIVERAIQARQAADFQSLAAQIEIKRAADGLSTFEKATEALDLLESLINQSSKATEAARGK